jgi:hypothetical protein
MAASPEQQLIDAALAAKHRKTIHELFTITSDKVYRGASKFL